jgi:hypothetical protein
MPFQLPPNQAEALKDARKIRDQLRRLENRHGDLFLAAEREQLADAIQTMANLQVALRVPPEATDQ